VRFDSGLSAHETVTMRSYLSTGIGWLLGIDDQRGSRHDRI